MTVKYSHGFPKFGEITDPDELIVAASLKGTSISDVDIPAPANAVATGTLYYDPVLGMKAANEAGTYLFYDGPSTKPWSSRLTELSTNRGFFIQFEVERAAFDTGATDFAGSGDLAAFQFRGAAGNGTVGFGRASVIAGHSVADSQITSSFKSGSTGFAASAGNCSKWANDKEYVPICLEIKRGRVNVYVDGYRAISNPCTLWATSDFDDFWLIGRQNAYSSTPAGFPYWMRNFQIINRRLVLPINPYADRMTGIGDSFMSMGDYDYLSPRDNSSHRGWNCDAGHTPMIERILARNGIFTNDIVNVGAGGSFLLADVSGTDDVMTQVNGSPTFSYTDATITRGKIAYVMIGVNDAFQKTTTITALRAALNTLLDAINAAGFEQILLGTIIDHSGCSQNLHASAAILLQRIIDMNTMYKEEAALRSNVHIVDLYTDVGPYVAAKFNTESGNPAADTLHPNEEIMAIIGRSFGNAAVNLVRNWHSL